MGSSNKSSRQPRSERPSRPSAPSSEAAGSPDPDTQRQGALDAVVVELDKKSRRVEELEKEVAELKARPVLVYSHDGGPSTVSRSARADQLEAFLHRSIKDGAINYSEAAELLKTPVSSDELLNQKIADLQKRLAEQTEKTEKLKSELEAAQSGLKK